jgi:thermitase
VKHIALPIALSALLVAGCVSAGANTAVNPAAGAAFPRTPAAHLSSAPEDLSAEAPPPSDVAVTHVIVKATSDLQAQAAILHAGGRVARRIEGLDAWVAEVPASDATSALAALTSQPGVIFAEADDETEVAGEFVPNDLAPDQDALRRLRAPAAWGVSTGEGIRIAVLDTGLDLDHEDFVGKVAMQANFSASPTLDDLHGHGTHVAGIAGAATDNGIGIAGAGGAATLMIGKVLGDDGKGSTAALVDGIVWAANQGARVINISVTLKKPSLALQEAINFAERKNALVVAAAGQKRGGAKVYPAAFDNVLAVTAVDAQNDLMPTAAHGNWVDVAAPGVGIYSTLPNHPNTTQQLSYGTLSGTSAAAPFVTGEAALLFKALGPDATAQQVRARIESSCTGGRQALGNQVNHGVVDFGAALSPEAPAL